jgi:hypothetical protein
MSHKNIGSDFDDFMKGEGMSYCSICGNDHEGTACPSHYDQDMPIYDAGMDAIDELNAALAAKEAELAQARAALAKISSGMGSDLLGTNSLSREYMQGLAQEALK